MLPAITSIRYKPRHYQLSKLYCPSQEKQCSMSPAGLMLCLMPMPEQHWHRGHGSWVGGSLSCPSSPCQGGLSQQDRCLALGAPSARTSFITLGFGSLAPQPEQPTTRPHHPGLSSQGCSLSSSRLQVFKLHLEMCAHYVFLNLFIFTFGRLIFCGKPFVGHCTFSSQQLDALWPGNDLTSKWSHAEVRAKVPTPLCINSCFGSSTAPRGTSRATEKTW